MGVDLTAGRWRTLSASVAGTAHTRVGEPCADASAVRVLKGGDGGSLLVAVAADGAGASPRAKDGARLACAAIVEQARTWAAGKKPRKRSPGEKPRPRDLRAFEREDVARFVDGARARVVAAARRESQDERDFSCTLLVALVDQHAGVFFQIGDGAIVYREDGRYVPALWPQSGEYANCTFFLTDPDAATRVQVKRARGVHEVALFTDGLQGLALHFASRAAHGPFFAPMFARLRGVKATRPRSLAGELQAFLDSPAVNQRTDDDKTLVLATRLR
jgi:Protein phosphatase 2C